jgi:hypothetical protein
MIGAIVAGGLSVGAPAESNSWESIESFTVGSGGTSSITFGSGGTIPQTYKHLQIRVFANVQFDGNLLVRLGSGSVDSGSNYSWHQVYGTGSGSGGTSSGASSTQMYCASLTNTTSTYGISIIDILDYANTNKYKTIRALDGLDANGSGVVDLASGSWRNTSGVDIVELRGNGNFTQYSSFALYGIKG